MPVQRAEVRTKVRPREEVSGLEKRRSKLAELHLRIRRCTRCPLHRQRKHAVPGEGEIDASILFVGEAPGQAEDAQGRLFVGRAGAFFDGLLESVGLPRSDVFLTSSVKCRPPDNRVPRVSELRACRPWLEGQIELVSPREATPWRSAWARPSCLGA